MLSCSALTLDLEPGILTTNSDSEATDEDEVKDRFAEVDAATERLAEEKSDRATDMVGGGFIGEWSEIVYGREMEVVRRRDSHPIIG